MLIERVHELEKEDAALRWAGVGQQAAGPRACRSPYIQSARCCASVAHTPEPCCSDAHTFNHPPSRAAGRSATAWCRTWSRLSR